MPSSEDNRSCAAAAIAATAFAAPHWKVRECEGASESTWQSVRVCASGSNFQAKSSRHCNSQTFTAYTPPLTSPCVHHSRPCCPPISPLRRAPRRVNGRFSPHVRASFPLHCGCNDEPSLSGSSTPSFALPRSALSLPISPSHFPILPPLSSLPPLSLALSLALSPSPSSSPSSPTSSSPTRSSRSHSSPSPSSPSPSYLSPSSPLSPITKPVDPATKHQQQLRKLEQRQAMEALQRECEKQGARQHAGQGAGKQEEDEVAEKAGTRPEGGRNAGQAAVQEGELQRRPGRMVEGLAEPEGKVQQKQHKEHKQHKQHQQQQQQLKQQTQAQAQVVAQQACSSVGQRYVLKRLEIFEVLRQREEQEEERERQDRLVERFTQAAEKEGIVMEGVPVSAKLRFLVDRQMDPNAAAHQYVAHRRWKQQYCKDSSQVDESELRYFQGCDYGCFQWVEGKVPLLVNRARLHDTDRCSSHDIARYCVHAFDKAIACCPPDFPQFNVILDLKHASLKQLDTRASLLIAEILQRDYPERLHCLFIVRVPFMFWPAWGIVSRFLRREIRDKIIIVHDRDMEKTLSTYIPLDVLPSEYGGQATFTNTFSVPVTHRPSPLE